MPVSKIHLSPRLNQIGRGIFLKGDAELINLEAEMTHSLNRITVNAHQCGGRPCIRGMRMRVKDILDLLAAGASREEILQDYPYLENEDITATLEYAALQSDHPVLRVA